jgi:hypothetical protein
MYTLCTCSIERINLQSLLHHHIHNCSLTNIHCMVGSPVLISHAWLQTFISHYHQTKRSRKILHDYRDVNLYFTQVLYKKSSILSVAPSSQVFKGTSSVYKRKEETIILDFKLVPSCECVFLLVGDSLESEF